MSVRSLIFASVAVAVVGGAVYPLLTRRQSTPTEIRATSETIPVVQAVPAEARPMRRTVVLMGTLKSGGEANLSPKQGGRILAVLVREGQPVRRGQVLVRLDNSDAARQAEQARAGVAAARANLEKARVGLRLRRTDVEQRVTNARAGLEQATAQLRKAEAGSQLQQRAAAADIQRAEAGLAAARSVLEQARKGARPEDRKLAELAVRQAERGVQQAKKNLDDVEFLYQKGGVPRIQLDQARDGYQKALDGQAQARSQLDRVNAGATAEEIAAAEAQVRSAEAGLAAARAAANRGEVDDADLAAARSLVSQAEAGVRAAEAARVELELSDSDVRAAQAALDQALAASRLANQQLQSAEIVSPLDGTVTRVTAHVGEMAGPGMPLVTVVGSSGVYLEASAAGRVLEVLRPGQSVEVTLDSARGKKFPGVVSSLGATAGPDGRTVPVRIDFSAPTDALKPGATARATVVAESWPEAVTVPNDALRADGDRTSVWVVRDDRITAAVVEPGVEEDGHVMVRGDVRVGDLVVISAAAGARPGQAVRVESPRSEGAMLEGRAAKDDARADQAHERTHLTADR